MKYIFILLSFLPVVIKAQTHPSAYITASEVQDMKKNMYKDPMFMASFNELIATADKWLSNPIDVPVPKEAAGGYSHEKHKENYNQMFACGLIYQLTGDKKYAAGVKEAFLKYAKLNPTLKNHPQATSNAPGRIFWQALNDANWLVYAGMAYDLIYNYLTPAERTNITKNAFDPIVQYFLTDRKDWFNLIHNHAVWATAGVGIVGIATDNKEYVQAALYGEKPSDRAGFIAHLDLLFSPDGYYNEGPYYTRYAILPFYLFANALNHVQPALKIFQHRNSILQKALDGALEQTNLDGAFYSYNDALKEKTYTSNEVVVALGIARNVYGARKDYLPIAKTQGRVVIHKGGLELSHDLSTMTDIPKYFPYKSVEYTDGADGKQGGVTILRTGKNDKLTSLIFKYSSHGLSHGHYDKLNINLYDNGNEILQDYGAVRFIGIEQKWGGRYLPETKGYAQHTIAHNTVTVDRTSHFNGIENESEKYAPTKYFSSYSKKAIQVVSAFEDKAYKDVTLQRTLFMVQLPGSEKPILVDVFRTISSKEHTYDLPFNYIGDVISTSFEYTAHTKEQNALGTDNGYEFLWNVAEARVPAGFSQFTFLNNNKFYTISTSLGDSSSRYFTRLGANDPNFNLRSQTAYIMSLKGSNTTIANVVEIHGFHSTVNEVATAAYSAVKNVSVLFSDEKFTVTEVMINDKKLVLMQCNSNMGASATHEVTIADKKYSWTGNYSVTYNNIKL